MLANTDASEGILSMLHVFYTCKRETDFNRRPHCRQRELRDKVLQAENSREAPDKDSTVRPRGVTDLDSLHEPR